MVKRIDTLLSTRGLLAMSVVFWHVEGYKMNIWSIFNLPGRTAVVLFFCLSGYVISHGFIHGRYSFSKTDLMLFYQRRIFRIMPLFLLISVSTIAYRFALNQEFEFNFKDILPQFFMMQFNHNYPLNTIFWTLGVEMQFYLIAPFLIYFAKYYLKSLFKQFITYSLLIGIFLIFASFDGIDSRNLIGNLFHFFSGILCCFYIKEKGVPEIDNKVLIFLILSLIAFTNLLYHISGVVYFTLGLLTINLCLPLLVFLHYNLIKVQINHDLSIWNFFLTFGTISYGIYAWHPFLIELLKEYKNLNFIALLTLDIALAYISYVFFEKPILYYVRKKK